MVGLTLIEGWACHSKSVLYGLGCDSEFGKKAVNPNYLRPSWFLLSNAYILIQHYFQVNTFVVARLVVISMT